eukprot:717414-Amphidinium_carterae.1
MLLVTFDDVCAIGRFGVQELRLEVAGHISVVSDLAQRLTEQKWPGVCCVNTTDALEKAFADHRLRLAHLELIVVIVIRDLLADLAAGVPYSSKWLT